MTDDQAPRTDSDRVGGKRGRDSDWDSGEPGKHSRTLSPAVKLTASDGGEIFLDRRAALVSGQIKTRLAQSSCGEVVFPPEERISSDILEKVVQYFYYKLRYANHDGPLPEFKIAEKQAVEVLLAANHLDC